MRGHEMLACTPHITSRSVRQGLVYELLLAMIVVVSDLIMRIMDGTNVDRGIWEIGSFAKIWKSKLSACAGTHTV
jgi:hypothetical protein